MFNYISGNFKEDLIVLESYGIKNTETINKIFYL